MIYTYGGLSLKAGAWQFFLTKLEFSLYYITRLCLNRGVTRVRTAYGIICCVVQKPSASKDATRS
jgi:hypothetical protein